MEYDSAREEEDRDYEIGQHLRQAYIEEPSKGLDPRVACRQTVFSFHDFPPFSVPVALT